MIEMMEMMIGLLGQTAVPPEEAPSTMLLLWGIVLVGAALVLFFLELFIPSAGIIVVMSFASLIGGLIMLFSYSTSVGVSGLLLVILMLPVLFGFGIKIWPHTFVAKALSIKKDVTNKPNDEGYVDQLGQKANVEVGMKGEAVTPLRPVGTCVIDGQRQECIAETGTIEKGTAVEVVVMDGMQIKVREVEE